MHHTIHLCNNTLHCQQHINKYQFQKPKKKKKRKYHRSDTIGAVKECLLKVHHKISFGML